MKYTHNSFPKLFFSLGFVFSVSYFVFSILLAPTITFQILAKNSGQQQFLADIFSPSANAAHSYIRTELSWDATGNATGFWCSTGVPVQFQNDTGNRDRAIWKECFTALASAGGNIPATPLEGNFWSAPNTYGGYGASTFRCQSGSTLRGYNIRINSTDDYNTEWYACSSNTPVPTTPPPPTFSPQPSCTGTSISANFSSAGASWYAVRLADLTSGSLISNGICDPASNGNETCQWQTGTSLNRTGIAGHTYRMWVHGATNTSWSPGTYSAATYATDFSCPAAVVTPPPPTFSPQPSCTGTSISANFSSAGASWYAVRLADLTSGSLISNGICDPASNGNETCQWQTGTSLNRTGIAGHTYRMWVHGATNTSWSPGTYSAATYATDFSCPAATYSCTGTTPANANICANDDSGLTANTGRTLVSSCTSGTKCEYVCSTGYVYSGGTCVLAGGGGGVPAPTVTLNASPTALAFGGGTTTLSWNTTNAASCMASGGWSGSKSTANGFTASQTSPSFSGTTTFTLQCWNSDNSASDTKSVTVTVAAGGGSFISPPAGYCVASPSPPNYADCSTWAKPTGLNPASYAIVNHGAKNMTFCQESVVVPGTWITNSTQCYGSGCWSGSSPQTSSGQYEVGTNYVAGTYQTYRCNVSTNIAEKNEGSGWSSVTWGSSGQPIRCVEVNTCSGSLTDLMGTMMSVTPLVPGNVTFTGMVANVSSVNATAPFDNVFQLDMNNNGSYSDLGDVTLTTPTFPFVLTGGGGAGSSAARSATYNMSAGNYNVRFFVDSGSVVPESNEANNYSASFPFTVGGAPSGPATAALEVVCTPITCGSVPEVVNYCTNETFSVSNPCGGFITCSGTKSCSNSDANWREVAP